MPRAHYSTWLLILALGVSACHGPGPAPGDTGEVCSALDAAGDEVFGDFVLSPHPSQPTLYEATWTTARAMESWLELAPQGEALVALPHSTAPQEAHVQGLRGLRPGTVYGLRLMAREDDALYCLGQQALETRTFDGSVPPVTVEMLDEARVDPGFLVTSLFPTASTMGTAIIDRSGALVWFMGNRSSMVSRFGHDQARVLLQTQAGAADEMGTVDALTYGGQPQAAWGAEAIHRDFRLVDTATVATLSWELRSFDDGARTIVADNLVELGAGGVSRVVFSPWDQLEIDLDQSYRVGAYPGDPSVEDWTHTNSLDFDPVEQAYYLLASDPEQVYKVDRTSGELLWVLGADGGDFAYDGEGPLIDFPHSVQRVDGGVLIFNRVADGCSEVVEIALDEDAMVAQAVWRHRSEECFDIYWMGQAERLPLGNTRIAWATAGVLDEVAPDGTLVRRLRVPTGAGFAFGEHVPDLYPEF